MTYLVSMALDPEAADTGYPWDLPAVRDLWRVEFGPVTLLTGANGSGKSTIVEALAVNAGFNAEGGSRNLRFETYATHSRLADGLVVRWDTRPRWGWFLRAETFYGMASHIHGDSDLAREFPDLHQRSHGESFLALVASRMLTQGFYVMDEPESALSFHGQLRLLRAMHLAVRQGAQFVVATHSPVLLAYPGAFLHELDDDGIERVDYDDVEAVVLWRNFLAAPDRFFTHLFADEDETRVEDGEPLGG